MFLLIVLTWCLCQLMVLLAYRYLLLCAVICMTSTLWLCTSHGFARLPVSVWSLLCVYNQLMVLLAYLCLCVWSLLCVYTSLWFCLPTCVSVYSLYSVSIPAYGIAHLLVSLCGIYFDNSVTRESTEAKGAEHPAIPKFSPDGASGPLLIFLCFKLLNALSMHFQ